MDTHLFFRYKKITLFLLFFIAFRSLSHYALCFFLIHPLLSDGAWGVGNLKEMGIQELLSEQQAIKEEDLIELIRASSALIGAQIEWKHEDSNKTQKFQINHFDDFNRLFDELKNQSETSAQHLLNDLKKHNAIYSKNEFQNRLEQMKHWNDLTFEAKIDHLAFIRGFVNNPDFDKKHYKDKDVVLLFGPTSSGKSSLFSLMTTPDEVTVEKYAFKHPSIGAGSSSKTFFPNFGFINQDDAFHQKNQQSNIALFDMPGLRDTRGFAHALAINLIFKQIFTEAQSVRMLFMIESGSFSERSQNIIETMQNVQEFLGKTAKVEDMSYLVLTKIARDDDCQCMDYPYFSNDIKAHIEGLDELKVYFKQPGLLNAYLENNRILFFHKPGNKKNEFNIKDPKNIMKAILQIPGQKINQVHSEYLLSDDSKKKVEYFFQSEIKEIIAPLEKEIQSIKEKKLHGTIDIENQNRIHVYAQHSMKDWIDMIQDPLRKSQQASKQIGDFHVTFDTNLSVIEMGLHFMGPFFETWLDTKITEELTQFEQRTDLKNFAATLELQNKIDRGRFITMAEKMRREISEQLIARYNAQASATENFKSGVIGLGTAIGYLRTPATIAMGATIGAELAGGATLSTALMTAGVGLNLATGGLILAGGAGVYGAYKIIKSGYNWWCVPSNNTQRI